MNPPFIKIKTTKLAALAATVLATGPAVAETLTLAKCIDAALRGNPDIATSSLEVEASIAQSKSARGAFGPRLHLDAGLQRWNEPATADFFSPILGIFQTFAGQNGLAFDTSRLDPRLTAPIAVRDQTTWSAGVTLAQPLTSLWTIREGYALRQMGVDIAEIQRKSSRRDVAFQVTEAYYRLLQATRLAEVAQNSVENVGAQVKRAQSFYRAGTVGRNDLLRAELGLAAAQQRLIQAKGGVILARGQLATLMGLPPDTAIEPERGITEPQIASVMPPTEAENRAIADRLEIKEIGKRVNQADAGVSVAKSKMIPQINAVANYTHTAGSAFAVKDAWFIGGTASWDIWEGGGTYYGIDEAKARLAQALSARRKAEDMIRLETRSAHVGVTTAAEALDVARHAVEQAEENFRIEQARYESADNTSFDVLDAESQLTTARGQHQAAIYDYLIAQSKLARATGRLSPI